MSIFNKTLYNHLVYIVLGVVAVVVVVGGIILAVTLSTVP